MKKYSQYLGPNQFVVFLLHGVVQKSGYRIRNYNRKHIEESYFEEVIDDLVSNGTAVSLDDYIESLSGVVSLPRKPFSITFDDGFENNFSIAAPILRNYRVPTTFYLTSDFIDFNTMSWIDKIELCLENFRPKEINLPWTQKTSLLSNFSSEKNFLNMIRKKVKGDFRFVPNDLVESIYEQCKKPIPTSSKDPLDLKMNWNQVEELSKDSLFTIGGHTKTHSILSYLDSRRMKDEIDSSINTIINKTNIDKVSHFSYPEGFAGSFNDETISLLKSRGIICSPSAIEGTNSLNDDPFRLKRIFIL